MNLRCSSKPRPVTYSRVQACMLIVVNHALLPDQVSPPRQPPTTSYCRPLARDGLDAANCPSAGCRDPGALS